MLTCPFASFLCRWSFMCVPETLLPVVMTTFELARTIISFFQHCLQVAAK